MPQPGTELLAVRRGYVIGATERSGSTSLCQLLRRTGQLGNPREHFDINVRRSYGNELKRGQQLWDDIVGHATTPNGVFGVKVFPRHLAELEPFLIAALMNLPVFHLRRRDALGQAISFSRARQTGQWVASAPAEAEARYVQADIKHCLGVLQRWEASMLLNYAINGADVTFIDYEDYVEDPIGTLSMIAERLQVAGVEVNLKGALQVQRDPMTEEWRERFLTEMRSAGIRWYGLLPPPNRLQTTVRRVRRGLGKVRRAVAAHAPARPGS